MESTLADTASRYIRAVGDGNFDEVASLLHPEIDFLAGGRTLHGPEACIEAFRNLKLILQRNEIQKVFVDGDEACVLYDFVTDTSAGTFFSMEWLTFEDGRIRTAKLLFNLQKWPEALKELAERKAGA